MKKIHSVITYLKDNKLILATAESCTAGKIIALLSKIPGCGECLYAGYVVYSEDAKKKLLNVKQITIDTFTLTSEEIAKEMAVGALKQSDADIVVATTGLAGDEPIDGIAPGTICFAWGFRSQGKTKVYTQTKQFKGARTYVQTTAAKYAILNIIPLHKKSLHSIKDV